MRNQEGAYVGVPTPTNYQLSSNMFTGNVYPHIAL